MSKKETSKQLAIFAENAARDLQDPTKDWGNISTLDALGVVLAITGVTCKDTIVNPNQSNSSTMSLLYLPIDGNNGHLETTWTHGEDTTFPRTFELRRAGNGSFDIVKTDPDQKLTEGVRVNHVFTKPTSHYWYYKNCPTELVANPNHTCTQGCKLCSRHKTKGFSKNEKHYIEAHMEAVSHDFDEKFPRVNKDDLKTVHITTGSQSTPEGELEMMIKIMESYKQAGFTKAMFELYSSQLPITDSSMKELMSHPIISYAATVEVVSDRLRDQLWGSGDKGSISFEEHAERVNLAQKYLNDRGGYTEVNMVVGMEGVDQSLKMLKQFPDSVIVPNIFRTYSTESLDLVSPEVWEMGLPYFTTIINSIIQHNQAVRPNNPKANAAKEWLRSHDLSDKLPRRRWF